MVSMEAFLIAVKGDEMRDEVVHPDNNPMMM